MPVRAMRGRREARIMVAGVATAAGALGACGGGGEMPSAQPSPDVTTFQPGVFDDLPSYPGGRAIGSRTDAGDSTARSFLARNATPRQVLQFFDRRLAERGWTAVTPAREIGKDTLRAEYMRGRWRLRVSATPESTGGGAASATVSAQYSLSLSKA